MYANVTSITCQYHGLKFRALRGGHAPADTPASLQNTSLILHIYVMVNRPCIKIQFEREVKRTKAKKSDDMLISFTFIATCFYCFCLLCLTITLNIDIYTSLNKVSAGQYHVTILRAQVGAVFFKLTSDQVLFFFFLIGSQAEASSDTRT